MIIRINNDSGKEIANCEVFWDECDQMRLASKSNIKNIYCETKQGLTGFDDCIDIDIDKIYNRQKIADDITDDIVTNMCGEEYSDEMLYDFMKDYFVKEMEEIGTIVDNNMSEFVNSDLKITNNRRN